MFQTITLVEITCCQCGCSFAMQNNFKTLRLEDGKLFYCPAGHSQLFSKRKNELKALKQKNESLAKRLTWSEQTAQRATAQAEQIKREKTALKGQLTKTRNRIANGVCPCCNRTFQNISRHMNSKHPDFKAVVS